MEPIKQFNSLRVFHKIIFLLIFLFRLLYIKIENSSYFSLIKRKDPNRGIYFFFQMILRKLIAFKTFLEFFKHFQS